MAFGIRPWDLSRFGVVDSTRSYAHRVPLDNAIHDIFKRENFLRANADEFWVADVYRQVRPLVGPVALADIRNINSPFWRSPLGSAKCWSWQHIDFSRNNPIPEVAYNRIRPALRLATLLLDHSLPFLTRIEYGEIESLLDSSRRGSVRRFRRGFNTYPNQYPEVRSRLQKIAGQTHFFCGQRLEGVDAESDIFYSKFDNDIPEKRRKFLEQPHPFYVKLDRDFFDRVTRDPNTLPPSERITTPDRDRMLLELALTLVHEIVHVYFFDRYPLRTLERWTLGIRPEPLYDPDDPEGELGYAWESWLCGRGRVKANQWPQRNAGLYWSPWERIPRYLFHGLLDDCVANFFDKNHWNTFKGRTTFPYDESGARYTDRKGLYLELTALRYEYPFIEESPQYVQAFAAEQDKWMGR